MPRSRSVLAVAALCAHALFAPAIAADTLDFERLAALRSVLDIEISPAGSHVAYVLNVPLRPGHDEDGTAQRHLHVVDLESGRDHAYVHGDVRVSKPRFTPDGAFVTYLAKRGDDEHASLWVIPVLGGESFRAVTHETKIEDYRVSPDGRRVALIALDPLPEELEKARKKGYKQRVFEEDWRHRKLWVAPFRTGPVAAKDPALSSDAADDSPVSVELQGSAFDVAWLPDGRRAVVTLAPTPLIDDRYMARRLRVVDVDTGDVSAKIDNPGKLGEFHISPDGAHIAMISAADPNDTREGRLMVAPTAGGPLRDLMPDFRAHVNDIAWQDDRTVMYTADVGAETELGQVGIDGKNRTTHARSGNGVPVLTSLSLSDDGRTAALRGETPRHPRDVYVMRHGNAAPQRLTDNNPWLGGVRLAPQEVIRWTARDGLELEGVLVRPHDGSSPAPLLLMVHGGPESQDRNGWITNYSRPAQLAAAQGYAVLFPNYRGSTGRGVEFAKTSQGDAAGKEFDDLVDAVDHLIEAGVADRDRVGINGGSYGGYATAWCSTFHSERFRAGVMFVGISNKVSKGLTTEIPVEDVMVHTRFDPWTKWQFGLERSPIYHAEKSKTAVLIAAGDDDTRVHPSQSLQLYRALKGIGKTPVRYVRYPGEGHGNAKAAARNDYARRLMRWMDWFVRDRKEGLPPWELEHDLGDAEDDEAD